MCGLMLNPISWITIPRCFFITNMIITFSGHRLIQPLLMHETYTLTFRKLSLTMSEYFRIFGPCSMSNVIHLYMERPTLSILRYYLRKVA